MKTDIISDRGTNISQADSIRITVAKSAEEVERLRTIWEGMDPNPYADIDYFLSIIASKPNVLRPHVLLLSKNGTPETMLIGMVEEVPFECKIGYKVLFKPTVRSLTVLDSGLLGDQSRTSCSALISQLISSLSQKEADIVYFQEIPTDSPLFSLGRKIPGFFSRDHFPNTMGYWRIALPPTMEDFYQSKKRKRNLERIGRRLHREFPGTVSIQCYRKREHIDTLCREISEISKKTYQYAQGGGFVDNPENRFLFELLSERGSLRGYVLHISGKPRSFWVTFTHKDALHLVYTGYDPEYRDYEIGKYLMLMVIEESISDEVIGYVDFSCGDHPYKDRFCNQSSPVSFFFIFRRSPKGITINALRTLNGIAFLAGDRILRWLNLREKYDRYKRTRSQ